MTAAAGAATIWHDVECGGYAADLATWVELAAEADGPVLELGAGTGRVCLHLARQGFEVAALERSPQLLDELDRRAAAEGLAVETLAADARELEARRSFALICAPMQLTHLLGGSSGRGGMLAGAEAALVPGGVLAAALLAESTDPVEHGHPPLPDVLERDGWVYSSLPIEVRQIEDGLEVRRLRQLVSPTGRLSEEIDSVRLDDVSPGSFELEAAEHGLLPRARRDIAATAEHVGSVVCVLESRR